MIDLAKFENKSLYNNTKSHLWYIVNNLILNSFFPFSNIKVFILRLFGAKIGNNVIIKPYVKVKYPWNLKIGDNSWIGEEVWIDNLEEVLIDENCCISQGVYLCTGSHNFESEKFDLIREKILIKRSSWIGAKAVICPGVTIEECSFIKAGEIVKNAYRKN